jgi:hypothetical protein
MRTASASEIVAGPSSLMLASDSQFQPPARVRVFPCCRVSAARFQPTHPTCCSKIAEAEAAVSVNEMKWSMMHVHVQMRLDELRAPPNSLAHCDMKVPGQLLPFFILIDNAINVW